MVSYETYTDIPSTGREYNTGRRGGDLSNNISKFPYSRFDNMIVEIVQDGYQEFIYAPRVPNEHSSISNTSLVGIATSSTNAIIIPFRASTDNINGMEISLKLSHDGYGAGKLRAGIMELDFSSVTSTTAMALLKTGKVIPTDEYLMDDSSTGVPWVDIDFGTTAGGKITQSTGLHNGATYAYLQANDHYTLTHFASAEDLTTDSPASKPFMIELHIGSYLSNPMRDLLLYDTTYGNTAVTSAYSTSGNNTYCDMDYTTITAEDIQVQAVTGKRMGAKNNLIPNSRIIPGRMYGLVITSPETFSTTAGGTAQVNIYGSPESARGKRNQPYIFSAWNNRTWKGKAGFSGSTSSIMTEYAHGWVADAAHTGALPSSSSKFSSIHTTSPCFYFKAFSKEKCELKSYRVSSDSGEKLTDSIVSIDIIQGYDYQRIHSLCNGVNMPESFEFYDEFHNVPEMEHADLLKIKYTDGNHAIGHLHFLFQIDHKEVATFSQTYL